MSHPDFAIAESLSTSIKNLDESYFIVVYILILIYCCFGLAVVCDVYFVPALQKLSYNIAGSTLMALGASVPELFASLIGVFITEDDIGTGSIIGSSCFNLIAVPAACAFVASASFTRKLKISPMPVIRNSAFYAITILVLLLIIKDNKVDILEALILMLFFVLYMALMIFSAKSKTINQDEARESSNSTPTQQNGSLMSSMTSADSAIAECTLIGDKRHGPKQEPAAHQQRSYQNQPPPQQQIYGEFYFARDDSLYPTQQLQQQQQQANYKTINERTPLVLATATIRPQPANELRLDLGSNIKHNNNQQTLEQQLCNNSLDIAMKNSICLSKNDAFLVSNKSKHYEFDDGFHDDNWVSSKWILVPMLPLTLSMKVLTPCKFKNTCWTIWTFLVSIALIGGLTYVSVWMVHLFGQTIGIPETVAGMTILSWGTGIPELIASIVLIKKTAQADMAICNTIGSNVIDVSFCLSLPWLVKCFMNKAAHMKPEVEIQSSALPWTSFTLLVSVLLLLLVFKLHNWILDASVGIWLSVIYVTFVGTATYLEYTFSESGFDLLSFL